MSGEFKKILGQLRGKTEPSPEELDDLARELKDVKPLKDMNTVNHLKPKPKAKAVFTREDEQRVLQEAIESNVQEAEYLSGDVISYARPGIQRSVLRKLRRGDYSIQKECDLHGMIMDDAKKHLLDFLLFCQKENLRCVRIVHGKGKRSGHGGPVIKPMVNRVLRKLDSVLAYHSARIQDGGTGAVVVLLKRK